MRAGGFGHEGKWVFTDASPAKAGVGGYIYIYVRIHIHIHLYIYSHIYSQSNCGIWDVDSMRCSEFWG